MTQLLIRLFIRDPDDTRDPAVRTAYGNLASLVGMACNLLLCIGKLVAAVLDVDDGVGPTNVAAVDIGNGRHDGSADSQH